MPPAARLGATLAVFAVTLALAMIRPRAIHEAWWTCLGAAAMLALGLVGVRDAVGVLTSAREPLLFLLALLLLAELIERSGFFDWAAIRAARLARGDGRALYRNVFLLGAAVTALLSLDTTAVILTPLVLAFVERLRIPARPYVFACAFVANTASLPLPISNLTNLLFAGTFGLSFGAFAARMLLPQVVALALTYGALRWLFRAQLPPTFAVERLPAPSSVIPHRGYFRAAVGALGLVCAGYFLGPLVGIPPYVPAFVAALLLAVVGARVGRAPPAEVARHIGWSVFPFVMGLFVLVRAVEDRGLAQWAVQAMSGLTARPGSALPLAVVISGAALASNAVNNLPAALLARSVLQELHAPGMLIYGALLGTNIGPDVVPFGSLATVLVLARARARGQGVGAWEFVRVGVVVTPVVLAAAALALAATYAMSR